MCSNKRYVLYKKALFVSSKRAILENEYILRSFVENFLKSRYSLVKINSYIYLISRLDDLTLYSLITSKKITKNNILNFEELNIIYDIRRYIFKDYNDILNDKNIL
ncbi:MAG: hypothetical protein SVN78_06345, partial [Deferribacterota bacterium]|nr:hypothetical protein [Deferribacterota bacterium]